jgi:transposase
MGLIPEEQRWRIVLTWNHRGKVLSATAWKLRLSLEVVKHWVRIYESTGAVQHAPKSGRKRALSAAAVARTHELILEEGMSGSRVVARQLTEEGHTTTTRDKKTIIIAARRVADELGRPIVAGRGKPRKQLMDSNMELRVAFSQGHLKRDWGNVMVTDRKRSLFQYHIITVNVE